MTVQLTELMPALDKLPSKYVHRALLDYAVVINEDGHFFCGACKHREEFLHNLVKDQSEARCTHCAHRLYSLGRVERSSADITSDRMAELAVEYSQLYPHFTFLGRVYRTGSDLYLDQVNPALRAEELATTS